MSQKSFLPEDQTESELAMITILGYLEIRCVVYLHFKITWLYYDQIVM